jgi:hypothetical protein
MLFVTRCRCAVLGVLLVASTAVALSALAGEASGAQKGGNPNPGVIPPNKRYQDLSAEWWQWVFSIPTDRNPLIVTDGTEMACGASQSGSVVFLAGTLGGTATRTCTVPTGTSLFVPLFNNHGFL